MPDESLLYYLNLAHACDEANEFYRRDKMTKLENTRRIIANQLGEWAEELFAPEMKLTFIARHPTNPECEIVITDDDMAAVAAVAERSSKRPAR